MPDQFRLHLQKSQVFVQHRRLTLPVGHLPTDKTTEKRVILERISGVIGCSRCFAATMSAILHAVSTDLTAR